MKDENIVSAIQQKDERAINYVIHKYIKLIWSIVSAVLKNVSATEDLEECVADVFVYLWQHPEKYDSRRGTLKLWLSMIARSQAIDMYRRLSKQNTVPLDDTLFLDQLDVVGGILAQETRQLLLSAIRSLKKPEQEIIIRRYYYDQKPKEIAIALDLSVKQVENHLYRTKRTLRNILTD